MSLAPVGGRRRSLPAFVGLSPFAARDRIVSIDAGLIDAGLTVVAEHGLSAYDAAYVAAARRHDWQLVSTDIRDLVSKGLAVTPDAADYP